MRYEVPFSSQYTDLGHHEWRARGCGITSLKMVMDFWHSRDDRYATTSLNELLQAGLQAEAYREGVGWSHAGLARLARMFGYYSTNFDVAPSSPTPETLERSWEMVCAELVHGPVLASMYSGLNPERGGGHIVVVTGFEDELVFFNDPEQMDSREGCRVLARDVFLRGFKRRYIVVRPSWG